ncbi:MAG: hypothetical protein CML20_20450 [Rheinheimera sp.]|nr:hypothetical protein [Rheinheimera sp.]|tara:strand:- start:1094 stop:1312 length:219 start_codon:yes stop_codon:yes gene_type:complete
MGGLGALGSITGGAPISGSPMTGGGSSAKNGDQLFKSNATFGGLNYGGTGVNPLLVGGLVVAALATVYLLKK